MGRVYALIDTVNERRFDLDKGDWRDSGLASGSPMTLAECAYGAELARPGVTGPHTGRALHSLWSFCEVAGWRLEIIDDEGGADVYPGWRYPEVGGVNSSGSAGEPFAPDPCAEQMAVARRRAKAIERETERRFRLMFGLTARDPGRTT